jgi:hypothetical protein
LAWEITCPEAVLPLLAIIRWLKVCLIQDYEMVDRVILEVFHTILVLAITLVGNVLSIPTIFQNTYVLGVHLHSID